MTAQLLVRLAAFATRSAQARAQAVTLGTCAPVKYGDVISVWAPSMPIMLVVHGGSSLSMVCSQVTAMTQFVPARLQGELEEQQ